MNDLRQPIYSLIEPIIEPVDKHENFGSAGLLGYSGNSPAE
jgi:hypothetical protein